MGLAFKMFFFYFVHVLFSPYVPLNVVNLTLLDVLFWLCCRLLTKGGWCWIVVEFHVVNDDINS